MEYKIKKQLQIFNMPLRDISRFNVFDTDVSTSNSEVMFTDVC
jgi:hypothetical protein